MRLQKAGKLDEACAAFETSNRLEPRAGTLLRLGECREANKQLASAWSAYQDALTKATDPKKKKFATDRIKVIEPKLSHLTVNVKARASGLEVKRDDAVIDSGLWNVAVPVNGGEYTIAASAPGHVAWSSKISVPVEGGQVSVDVPALAEVPAPAVVKDTPKPEPVRDEPPPAAGTWTGRRKLAVGLVGGAAAVTVAGIVLGHSAQSQRDDAYRLCPDPAVACANAATANSDISSAHSRAVTADVAFGIAGAAAIVAGVLWFTGAPDVRVEASGHGGGISFAGRF